MRRAATSEPEVWDTSPISRAGGSIPPLNGYFIRRAARQSGSPSDSLVGLQLCHKDAAESRKKSQKNARQNSSAKKVQTQSVRACIPTQNIETRNLVFGMFGSEINPDPPRFPVDSVRTDPPKIYSAESSSDFSGGLSADLAGADSSFGLRSINSTHASGALSPTRRPHLRMRK